MNIKRGNFYVSLLLMYSIQKKTESKSIIPNNKNKIYIMLVESVGVKWNNACYDFYSLQSHVAVKKNFFYFMIFMTSCYNRVEINRKQDSSIFFCSIQKEK